MRLFKNLLMTTQTNIKQFSHFFKGGQPLNPYVLRITGELQSQLDDAAKKRRQIETLKANADQNLKKAIQDQLRYTWTYNSNAIEGSSLTLGDTIFLLQEGITVSGKPFKDYLDAINHSHAIDYVHDAIQGSIPIDSFFLRSLNAILLEGVKTIAGFDSNKNPIQWRVVPGEYKTTPNYVIQPDSTIHHYVEPFDVPAQINDLCNWIQENHRTIHPVSLSAIAHYNFVRIHPFQDGNGRGARLLMNLLLMKNGYQPAVIQSTDRQKYLETLKAADSGNLTPFTSFIAQSVLDTQKTILDSLCKKSNNNNSKAS